MFKRSTQFLASLYTRHRHTLCLGSLSLLLCHNIAAADTARAALTHFLANLDTLQARFEQSVYHTDTALAPPATGLFQLKRPHQFRWDYQTPEKKLVLADGRDVWIVENDLEQITQHYQSTALKNTPATILLGTEPLETHFNSIEQGTHQGLQWLKLQPKDPKSDIKTISLGFRNNELRRLALVDQLDQITQIRLYAIQRNLPLAAERFIFNPPADWDLFQH